MNAKNLLVGILAVGIVVGTIYFATRTGTRAITTSNKLYENEEKWQIKYNEDGLPTEIIINRKVSQQ